MSEATKRIKRSSGLLGALGGGGATDEDYRAAGDAIASLLAGRLGRLPDRRVVVDRVEEPLHRQLAHEVLPQDGLHVDVGARLDIYGALRDKAAEGTSVLVKSSDAIELAGICDRVVVMSRGVIVDEIPREELEERRIIAAIIGRGSAHGGRHGE